MAYASWRRGMERLCACITGIVLTVCLWTAMGVISAQGHFGIVLPSRSMVVEKEQRLLNITVAFSHPMEAVGMDMALPRQFGALVDGKKHDLRETLLQTKIMQGMAWRTEYTVTRPGIIQLYMEPEPYWEPAEDAYIQHMVKTCVAAFGIGDGWHEPVGLRAEIVPLTRPFGNYVGNVFQGRVLFEGKPMRGAVVEVEYYNQKKDYAAPNEYFVTQSVITDDNGVFTYAVPWGGWWGFAALHTAPETIAREGEQKSLEIGAVLWAEFVDPAKRP